MRDTISEAPERRGGIAGWAFAFEGVEVRFLGAGTPGEREAGLPPAWVPNGVERARLKQVHGDTAVEGRPGWCGEGDALWSDARHLALEIATADCVPVLLASSGRIAAAHAGWRGVASSIAGKTAARLGDPAGISAWIGPSIGSCCYEVEEPVARAVEAASGGAAVVAGTSERGRPRLDLVAAVVAQLARAGVTRIVTVLSCTRCHPDWLWSYRRSGAGAGRNLALVWRS